MPYFVELSSLVMAIGIRDFLSVFIISISTGTEHSDQHTDSEAGGQGLRMSKS